MIVTDYHQHSRLHLLDFAAGHMEFQGRALDVGCAAGKVGEELLRRGFSEVWGVEPDAHAAALARDKLTRVIAGFFPCDEVAGGAPFDAVVFADSLEHMVDPWAALRSAAESLKDGGMLLISVPNVSHYSVIMGLLRGRWRYTDEGLLDRSHLRFFTPHSARKAVRAAGFEIRCEGGVAPRPRRRYVPLVWILGLIAPHTVIFQTYVLATRHAMPREGSA
jgi:2-polyprenyl-3-methyl-5-hydroxy-6-metoxy-1,4-benzoquinol methylase